MASPGKAAASWRPSATLPPVSITATAASPTMKPTLAMAPALAGVITAAAPWWMNTPGAISVTGSGSGAGCAWLRAVAHASMIALARCLYGRPGIRACYTDGPVERIATRGIRRAAHGAGRGGAAGVGAAGRLWPGRPAGARWISAGQLPRADPGSSWLPDTGYGALAPATEAYLATGLATLSGGDRARPIVIYCQRDCWMSWNAAKRALASGYTNIIWYPEGTDGWQDAGLPLEPAQPVPRPGE